MKIQISPTFLFCSGMRCGSTLLQRMLIESGEIMVWGETGGASTNLNLAWQGYLQMIGPGGKQFQFGLGGNGDMQRKTFSEATTNRAHLWIPCINPPMENILKGFRKFYSTLYDRPSQELGFSKWGIKKVRSDIKVACFFKEIFPEAKFIFLVRNPLSCMRSIKQHNWMDHPNDPNALDYYIQQWIRISESFLSSKFGMLIRYEDMIGDSKLRKKLYQYLDIDGVNKNFFSQSRPKGKTDGRKELKFFERRKIKRKTHKIASKFGYNL